MTTMVRVGKYLCGVINLDDVDSEYYDHQDFVDVPVSMHPPRIRSSLEYKLVDLRPSPNWLDVEVDAGVTELPELFKPPHSGDSASGEVVTAPLIESRRPDIAQTPAHYHIAEPYELNSHTTPRQVDRCNAVRLSGKIEIEFTPLVDDDSPTPEQFF